MKHKSFLWLIIYFLFVSISYAQKPIWTDIALEEEVNLEFLEKDTIGFIWGLSKSGFYKYDGFQLSKKISKPDLSTDFLSLTVDKKYNFLIGTSKGELIHFNPYKHKIVKQQKNEGNLPITFLDCTDADSSCLVVSYGNGVIWNSMGIDTFLTIENILISNEVYAAVNNNNNAVLATDQGIQIIEKKNNRISSKILDKSNGLGAVIIPNLIKDKGYYWASNFDSQIYQIDTSTLSISTIQLPLKSKINGLKFIGESELAVFTNDGIYSWDKSIWIKKYPTKGSQEVLDITTDEESNIWACSSTNNLSKANLSFQLIPNSISKAQAILKIEDSFWIGSSEGLFIVNGTTKRKISDKNVTCIKRFNDDILVGTFSSGIHIFNNKNELVGEIDGWENNPNQSVLYLYSTDDFLFVSSLTGVLKMELSKVDQKYEASNFHNLNDILGPGYIYQILEDKGSLYFATDRQGIKIIQNDSLIHITHFQNGNTLGSIYSMTKCNFGRIWFASSTGYIGYVENNRVQYINNERYLQDPYTSLISTMDNKIVLVRNNSIDVYDPLSNHFLYYNNITQLPDQDLYLNCFTQEKNDIWLAKSNGILKIGRFDHQKMVPETIINRVNVNLIEAGKTTIFSEDQNNLEFKYSAAWMTDPEKITYQYKLEGLEENWRTTRDQSALYPMLRPGEYTFKIRASEDGRFLNLPEKSYQFTIRKSFYKTWWFLVLVLAVIAGIIIKWRGERKKARQQKEALNKKRIEAQLISLQTQLNPHFLFNSFNTLIGLIEENPAKSIVFTEKLTDFYRNILEYGKNDLILLIDEIKLLETYIHLIKERFGEQLIIHHTFKENLNYKIPPLTLQLLVENAIKHNIVSTKKPLKIDILQVEDKIFVTNKIQLKYGNTKGTGIGLENIKKRHSLNNLKSPHIEQSESHFIVTLYLNTTKI